MERTAALQTKLPQNVSRFSPHCIVWLYTKSHIHLFDQRYETNTHGGRKWQLMMLITWDNSSKRSRSTQLLCKFAYNQTPTFAAFRSNTSLFCHQKSNISWNVMQDWVQKKKQKLNYITFFQEVQKQPKVPEALLVTTTDSWGKLLLQTDCDLT